MSIEREELENILQAQSDMLNRTLEPVEKLAIEIAKLSVAIADFQAASITGRYECRTYITDHMKDVVDHPLRKLTHDFEKQKQNHLRLIIIISTLCTGIGFVLGVVFKLMP
jgi:hypothetical protein